MSYRMKHLILALAVVVLFTSRPAAATSIVVYDNFGPGNSYNPSSGAVVGANQGPGGFSFEIGTTFTPTTSSFLDEISVPITNGDFNNGASVLNVAIRANTSDKPGAVLESIQFAGPFNSFFSGGSVITLESVLHPSLIAGTTYWLDLSNGISASNATLIWL